MALLGINIQPVIEAKIDRPPHSWVYTARISNVAAASWEDVHYSVYLARYSPLFHGLRTIVPTLTRY
jgi:hypothetical protein